MNKEKELEFKLPIPNFILQYEDSTKEEKVSDYPFIESYGKKYNSSHLPIHGLIFKTVNEVVIANSIYEIMKNKFDLVEFERKLKYVFCILDIHPSYLDNQVKPIKK